VNSFSSLNTRTSEPWFFTHVSNCLHRLRRDTFCFEVMRFFGTTTLDTMPRSSLTSSDIVVLLMSCSRASRRIDLRGFRLTFARTAATVFFVLFVLGRPPPCLLVTSPVSFSSFLTVKILFLLTLSTSLMSLVDFPAQTPTFQQELAVLIGLLAVCVLHANVHYGCNVVNQMLDHFKLRAFVIESPQKKSKSPMKPFHSLLLLCCAPRRCSARAGGRRAVQSEGRPRCRCNVNKLPVCPAGHHCAQVNEASASLLDGEPHGATSPCSTSGSARTPADKGAVQQAAVCGGPGAAAHTAPVRTCTDFEFRGRTGRHFLCALRWPPGRRRAFRARYSARCSLWTQTSSFRFYFSGQRIVFVRGVNAGERRTVVDLAKLQPGSQVAFHLLGGLGSSLTSKVSRTRAKSSKDTSFFPKTLEIHWLVQTWRREDEEADEDSDRRLGRRCTTSVFRPPKQQSALHPPPSGWARSFFWPSSPACSVMARLLGLFNVHHHGNINFRPASVLYAFTSGIAGLRVLSNVPAGWGGERWARNVLLTSFLFAFPLFMVWAVVNSCLGLRHHPGAALVHRAAAAVPVAVPRLSRLTILAAWPAKKRAARPGRLPGDPRLVTCANYRDGPCTASSAGFLSFKRL
uniref:Transmembrane 9 superfamily member n=1 Tax=Macrostomum lignano TaxID=282301 RepID=A0A1I8FFH7_9PLAT